MCMVALKFKHIFVLLCIGLAGFLSCAIVPWIVFFWNSLEKEIGIVEYIICSVLSTPFLIAFFWFLPGTISCYIDARKEAKEEKQKQLTQTS